MDEKEALLKKEAKAGKLNAKRRAEIDAFFDDEEKIEKSFEGAKYIYRGPVLGRPKKDITREVAAIRIPSDALAKIKALGKGWSTRAGDALANLVRKGLL
jgi:uncharacterized protein (DUF4415 family)